MNHAQPAKLGVRDIRRYTQRGRGEAGFEPSRATRPSVRPFRPNLNAGEGARQRTGSVHVTGLSPSPICYGA